MRELIEQFLAHLATERRLAINTVAAYRNDLRQFARYLESSRATRLDGWLTSGPSLELSRELVVDYMLSLREDNGYAPATVARKMAALKALCHYLHKVGILVSDPTSDVGAPEVKKPLPRPAGVREIIALLEQAARRTGPEGARDRAMLRLLYSTGMRVSELVSLDVSDVDLQAMTVRCVGRGGRARTVPMDAGAAEELRVYLERARDELRRHAAEAALFLNHRGQRLTRQGFWLIMKVLAREAGLTAPVTPHMLRHSFAAHRLRDGLTLKRLKEILGHANIATTQVYAQLPVDETLGGGRLTLTSPREQAGAAGR